ncbi:MAG: hypothetical protein VKL42_03145 [Snowella sp.]|nr:hypothetical protein [Snowella sp.]
MNTLDTTLVKPFIPTIKQRNSFFDALFYDIGNLTNEEISDFSPLLDREGSIIVIPPQSSNKKISRYPNVSSFLESELDNIRIVAIAGVGSTALGTAALARNIANVYEIDVVGIVSGYGVSDLITEALGGWFFYSATDAIRHEIREALNRFSVDNQTESERNLLPIAQDVNALIKILNASPPNLSLLVGHSKGDFLLDFALENFVKKLNGTSHPYFENLQIATFGAVADFPPEFKNVHQFLGAIDWFGGINSRLDVHHIKVPNAWHHLNSVFPFYLPIEKTLKQYVKIT